MSPGSATLPCSLISRAPLLHRVAGLRQRAAGVDDASVVDGQRAHDVALGIHRVDLTAGEDQVVSPDAATGLARGLGRT